MILNASICGATHREIVLAGFVAGYDKGPEFSLALAMAAGAATAASEGIASGEEILKVLSEM